MLAIRMQRTGRKGHAMFRVVVQDSRLSPASGRVVALLGSYDPHAKNTSLDKEKASAFLKNGAQPSDRVARLLKSEGVKLPKWVALPGEKASKTRNLEKLRKNRPADAAAETPVETEPEAAAEEGSAPPDGKAEAQETAENTQQKTEVTTK